MSWLSLSTSFLCALASLFSLSLSLSAAVITEKLYLHALQHALSAGAPSLVLSLMLC